MAHTLTVETIRNDVQQQLRGKLAVRDPQQLFAPAELADLLALGQARLQDALGQLDQLLPSIDAEAEAAVALLARSQLSVRLRQFLHATYEQDSPP